MQPNSARVSSESLRERLSRFAIRPWEREKAGWNRSFLSAMLLNRYVKEFQARHRVPGHPQFPSVDVSE